MKIKHSYYLLTIFSVLQTSTNSHWCALTLPKSGTNLILKLCKLMTNNPKQAHIHVSALNSSLDKKHIWDFPQTNPPINLYWGHAWNIIKNNITSSSLSPNAQRIDILRYNRVKLILVLRDPREHLMSLLRSIKKPLNNKTLVWAIKNFPQLLKLQTGDPSFLDYKNITECYRAYLQWHNAYPNTYLTHFEKLVGDQGGGDAAMQIEEIQRIANFLEVALDKNQISDIANKLFGGTPTFKQGKTNSWKKYFKPEVKTLFKEFAGQLLIDLGYETDLNW
jgi:hypothetical protein